MVGDIGNYARVKKLFERDRADITICEKILFCKFSLYFYALNIYNLSANRFFTFSLIYATEFNLWQS